MAQVQVSTYDENGNRIATSQVQVADESVNADQLTTKALQALQANANFLALAAPTGPQVAAQVQSLTRQVNALIRLRLGATADISGT